MTTMDSPDSQKLAAALKECERLQAENRQLKERLGIARPDISVQFFPEKKPPVPLTSKASPEEKVTLFRQLFRGRDDIYAVRWEGRNGKKGYSPVYQKVWESSFGKDRDEPLGNLNRDVRVHFF